MRSALLVADINLTKSVDKTKRFKGEIDGVHFCAIVNTDSNGHEIKQHMSTCANKFVYEFVVVMLDEALKLCSLGIRRPINVMGHTDINYVSKRRKKGSLPKNIIPMICKDSEVDFLPDKLKTINIKLSMGKGENGVKPQGLRKLIQTLIEKNYKIKGIYANFSGSKNSQITQKQFNEFQRIILPYKDCGYKFYICSLNN